MNETLVKEKTASKKMNATNAKALNSIKQKLKRNNRTYEADIETYRTDKDAFMVEEAEEETVRNPTRERSSATRDSEAVDDDGRGFSEIGRKGKPLHEKYTPESIKRHLRIILGARGKKNTDRVEQISVIDKLYEVANTPWQKIITLSASISTRFDLSTGVLSYMALDQWKRCEI